MSGILVKAFQAAPEQIFQNLGKSAIRVGGAWNAGGVVTSGKNKHNFPSFLVLLTMGIVTDL